MHVWSPDLTRDREGEHLTDKPPSDNTPIDAADQAIARRTATAEARKLEAEANKAATDAALAEAEIREWNSAAARRARTAGHDKAVADARAAATDAPTKALESLTSGLTGLERGTTTVGDTPLFTTVLTQRSLAAAATNVVTEVKPALVEGSPVLIVTDEDQASSDAAYLLVTTGLDQIQATIEDALGKMNTPKKLEGMGVGVAAAAAAVLPPILSGLTSNRSLTGSTSSIDPALTVASVTSGLRKQGIDVIIDDFRVLDASSRIIELEKGVREHRTQLNDELVKRTAERDLADQQRGDAQLMIDELTKHLATPDLEAGARTRLEGELRNAKNNRDKHLQTSLAASTFVEHAVAVLEKTDTFLTAIRAVPDGGSRSQVVSAMLREIVHGASDQVGPSAPRVVFLRATGGSISQLVDDRPFLFKDRFHAIGNATIAFWVLDVSTNMIVAAGACNGGAQIKGKVGDSFTISELT